MAVQPHRLGEVMPWWLIDSKLRSVVQHSSLVPSIAQNLRGYLSNHGKIVVELPDRDQLLTLAHQSAQNSAGIQTLLDVRLDCMAGTDRGY